MKIASIFSKVRRSYRWPDCGYGAFLLVYFLSDAGMNYSLHTSSLLSFDIILVAITGPIWLFAIRARLIYLGRSLLWILPIIFPLALLAFVAYRRFVLLYFVALALVVATQLALYKGKPRIGTPPARIDGPEDCASD